MIDLLGMFVPSKAEKIPGMSFIWKDGLLIKALREGHWVLLKELNLASQTVLEGMNSIFDHRGSIYIPEIDKTITKHKDFRIFASQNPFGNKGRKGLPYSFLNRFIKIFIYKMEK